MDATVVADPSALRQKYSGGEVALKPGGTTHYYQVGKLRDDRIDVFSRYHVKYVKAYARLGIRVDALTLLDEPGMDVVHPAMDISVAQQQKLTLAIKRELHRARLDTELYVHDFSFWDWRDPNSTATKNYYRIFEDAPDGSVTGEQVRDASDGVAFHPYWGDPTVMRDAYEETGKPVHLTETSDLSPSTVLDDFRLDASSYLLWAQTTDQDGGTLHWTPARDNDIDWDEVAATTKWPDRLVKVNTLTKDFTVRDELYEIGQFAKYLSPGDVRLESSGAQNGVSNVVYRSGRKGFTYYTRFGGTQPPRIGTQHATIAPYGAFTCADGKDVLFSIQNEREWAALCERFLHAPGLVDDPRFATGSDRVAHRDELNAIVAERCAASDSVEVMKALDDAVIANAGVNDIEEFLAHPVLDARGRWQDVRLPGGVAVPALIPPADLAGVPPRMDAVPAVGEHTERVLAELGYSQGEIETLRADQVL